MNKEEVLAAVARLTAAGELSEAEVVSACKAREEGSRPISPVFAVVGAALVVYGAYASVSPMEDHTGAAAVLLCVAVIAIGAAAIAKARTVASMMVEPLVVLGAAVTPGWLCFGASAAGYDVGTPETQLVLAMLGAAIFAFIAFWLRSSIAVVAAALMACWSVMSAAWLFGLVGAWPAGYVHAYTALILGIALVCIAFGLRDGGFGPSFGLLATFGAMAVLISGMCLCEFGDDPNWLWITAYPAIALFGMICGATLRFRGFVYTSCLAMFAYLVALTMLFFKDMVSWGVVVAVFGVVFIAVASALERRIREIPSAAHPPS